ncbi:MAG: SEC-C domain-containing protein [Magnetococcales bacterium]|nr:SEC-C domain-containing protein [Magnetococcales bacterium]
MEQLFDHTLSNNPKFRENGFDQDELLANIFGTLPHAIETLTAFGTEMAAENKEFLIPPQTVSNKKKIGRNEPCPCGSGKKFKKCCIGL